KVDEIEPANNFLFKVQLDSLMELLRNKPENTYNWFFKIRTPYSELTQTRKEESDIKLIDKDGQMYAEYFIRCGRFQYTEINGLSFYYQNEDSIINYITTKGNLSLTVNNEPDSPTRLQIDKVKKKNNTLQVEGIMFTRNALINNG